jgi:high-affinity nickel-transport protein
VSTLVSRESSPRAALRLGALWGLGHTVTILLVGGAIVLFGLVVPPRLGLSLEMSVAVMLILLGALNLSGARLGARQSRGAHLHAPGLSWFRAGFSALRHGSRSLLVGVVHGLAGSAAIALLVLTTIGRAGAAVAYLGVFGLGTVAGMMLVTALMALPLKLASERFSSAERFMARTAGALSLAFGLFLAYRIGFVDGLLLGEPTWLPE